MNINKPAIPPLAPELIEQFRKIYEKPTLDGDDLSWVRRSLDEIDARAYCERQASELKESAVAELARLELQPEPREELIRTAEFLLERES